MGDAVALVHLNDAKNELGSHRDGHRKVGEGRIPVDAWPEFFDGLPGFPWSWRRRTGPPKRTLKRCGWSRSWRVGCAKRRLEDRI